MGSEVRSSEKKMRARCHTGLCEMSQTISHYSSEERQCEGQASWDFMLRPMRSSLWTSLAERTGITAIILEFPARQTEPLAVNACVSCSVGILNENFDWKDR